MTAAVGFVAGLFTAVFLLVIFDMRPRGLFKPRGDEPFKNAIAHRLSAGPYIVAVGGGTGLSTLLRGLKGFTRNITAVVAVTDEGGSSGRLRTEWGVLPPGDVRNCMIALAENDNELKRLLDFRFDRGDLAGHSLGNLFLLAVSELCGDFSVAVQRMNHLLAIRGRVLPVTTETITLVGRGRERTFRGEIEISKNGRFLESVWLEPDGAKPLPDALLAVDDAELVVLGPGSLFTSVIPNLLLPEFSEKLIGSASPIVYVCNLMTQPEETEGMSISRHLEWVSAALGDVPDYIVVNNESIPEYLIERYRIEGAEALYLSDEERERIEESGCSVLEFPMISITESGLVRHDSSKLAERLFRLCRELRE